MLCGPQDEMAKLRREMPRHLVKEDYEFTREDGSKVRLSELFGDEHDSLIVVHFMFDPAWERGCKSCSLWGDGYDGIMAHLNRKAAFTCVSMAPPEKIAEFKAFKGWSFPWVSSGGNSFNADYGVHFTPEEIEAKHKKFNYGRSFPACVVLKRAGARPSTHTSPLSGAKHPATASSARKQTAR